VGAESNGSEVKRIATFNLTSNTVLSTGNPGRCDRLSHAKRIAYGTPPSVSPPTLHLRRFDVVELRKGRTIAAALSARPARRLDWYGPDRLRARQLSKHTSHCHDSARTAHPAKTSLRALVHGATMTTRGPQVGHHRSRPASSSRGVRRGSGRTAFSSDPPLGTATIAPQHATRRTSLRRDSRPAQAAPHAPFSGVTTTARPSEHRFRWVRTHQQTGHRHRPPPFRHLTHARTCRIAGVRPPADRHDVGAQVAVLQAAERGRLRTRNTARRLPRARARGGAALPSTD